MKPAIIMSLGFIPKQKRTAMAAFGDNPDQDWGRYAGHNRRTGSDPRYKGPERRLSKRRSGKEKRRHPRYRVKDQVYVCLRSETGEEVGRLLDISMGGLSLRYLGGNEKSTAYQELGILAGVDLARERFAFKTVSDQIVEALRRKQHRHRPRPGGGHRHKLQPRPVRPVPRAVSILTHPPPRL